MELLREVPIRVSGKNKRIKNQRQVSLDYFTEVFCLVLFFFGGVCFCFCFLNGNGELDSSWHRILVRL